MSRTALQMASLRGMLEVLHKDTTVDISFKELAYYLTADEIDRIKTINREQIDAINACSSPLVPLSCDAEAYWERAKKAMAASRLAHNLGCQKREKAASLLCEQASEFYDAVIAGTPSQVAFLEHSMRNEAQVWDDRWHNTVDFKFPLLIQQTPAITDPLRYAQITVLEEILDAVTKPSPAEKIVHSDTSAKLLQLARRLN
ncbi:hypothetical protein [Sphingobium yanoikuyae]